MRYLIGTAALLAGGWLAYMSYRQWRVVRTGLAEQGRPTSESPMSVFGEIMRPILLFALLYVGAKTTFVFFWLDAQRHLSLLDLGGFWFLLLAYGAYVVVKTRYPLTLLDAAAVTQTVGATDATTDVDAHSRVPTSGHERAAA
ncbi:MAG TPA: hypothetical protein VLT59_12275 [Steroidobacteraceae bacterium]|nr:hypothetical protein [Steroidobacteraceae bacterium]